MDCQAFRRAIQKREKKRMREKQLLKIGVITLKV